MGSYFCRLTKVSVQRFPKEISNVHAGKTILSSFIMVERADERAGPSDIGATNKIRPTNIGVNKMPFETPFPPAIFAGTIDAVQHEHGGVSPQTIIRTDQSWAINVRWTTTGLATG